MIDAGPFVVAYQKVSGGWYEECGMIDLVTGWLAFFSFFPLGP